MSDLITGHEFEPWRWSNGEVTCNYWDPEHPTRAMCDRPAAEHERVPEVSQEGDTPKVDKATSS